MSAAVGGRRPLSWGWALPLVLVVGHLAGGCISLSHSVRDHTLEPGQVRLGAGMGLARPLGLDVAMAEPSDIEEMTRESFPPVGLALLMEGSIFYGLSERLDVGARVRLPFSPIGWNAGVKLESMFQVLSERRWGHPLDLAIGVGLDGVYRPFRDPSEFHTEVPVGVWEDANGAPQGDSLALVEDGGFNLRYWGLMGEVPIVLARRVAPHMSIFGGVRWGYLHVSAEQRYEAPDSGFDRVEYTKEVGEHTLGWMAGLSMTTPTIGGKISGVLIPQLYGYTVDVPGLGLRHQVGGTLEMGIQF